MQYLINEARRAIGLPVNEVEGPADVSRYYDDCKKKNPDKDDEYCARVAWQIYCMHKNPDYPGCTKYGKTRASGPIS